MDSSSPNILITGTPGVGKTILAETIIERTGLKSINVSEFAKMNGCIDGFDDDLKSDILDEDRLLDEMEPLMKESGNIVDYHSSEFFPERFFDAVFVLRTDTTILFDRLKARGYGDEKIKNNMEYEIFQGALDQARESYKEEIVHELPSNTLEDLDSNVNNISTWIGQFIERNK